MKGQNVLFSRKTDEWYTPKSVMDPLEEEFGKFTLDPCCTKENKKGRYFFTAHSNGLKLEWFGRVFVNPHFQTLGNG